MSVKIDSTDREILKMLQEDARVAFKRIAEKIGVSEATVFVRVKKLRKKGVIKRFTALVSPELLGKNLTAFVLINTEPKKLEKVLDTLSSMDEVYEAYDVTGTYYAIVKIRTENRETLAEIIDKIGMIDGVTRTETAIVLKCVKEETRIKI
ncbi:Lrp/AsnC family transcriptional regulator [Candidatus Bathyarchaeota archaeon]|nr:Lrp/AsnC family transcriptional regulator [Candidatus Bathyarchaeota archaeon]RJS87099.1 MAG: Lrp/AsnC family transcriptional regulator [Candidatus Bathyarchaeota archaeon]RLI04936.1 MAG: AsnC family transcriptional regulator [Candidatus Bathyarchaeota archaeon]